MKNWDDEIHRALAHPIRRRIIECLQERDVLSFNELLKRIANGNHGKLGFHIRALRGLVEREPSMKKYRLTDRGQLAGDLIWDIRLRIATGGRDFALELALKPAIYVRRLKLGDHSVLFYDTEAVKREISFPYLLAGLLKSEAVVCVVSENKLDLETGEIQRYGISVDSFRKGAFAIMSADEWFLKKGKAQVETIIANLQALVNEKRKAGFAGVRVAVEMNLLLDYNNEELLRLEATLGRPTYAPANLSHLIELCIYETRRLDEEQFIQLNRSHGHSVFEGLALKTA